MLKTKNSQLYQCYYIVHFYLKNRKIEYGKSQKAGEGGGKNKINSIVKKNSGFEISVYYYKIYRYQQKLIVLK